MLQLEDLCKQAAVSLGYRNLKEEQKRVATSFFSGKDISTAHAEDIHVIVQALTIPSATDTSWVY